MIALIVAYTKNKVIGNQGCISWKIKGEQKRFRELTTGNVVVMGRRSYEEIGKLLRLPGTGIFIFPAGRDCMRKQCLWQKKCT